MQSLETVAPHWRHMTEGERRDLDGTPVQLVDFTDVYIAGLDGRLRSTEVIADLAGRAGIDYVECDPLVSSFAFPDRTNDPTYPLQWYLNSKGYPDSCEVDFDINAPEAWALWDSAGTKIGISDAQVDTLAPGFGEYVDAALSRSFVPNEEWFTPFLGRHGTKVASIAAAATNDSVNIASLANLPANRNDHLVVALYVNGGPSASDSLASRGAQALDYVCSSEVAGAIRIVNHSWGSPSWKNCLGYSETLRDAFRNAFVKGINLDCAAGNRGECPPDTARCEPTETDTCFAYPAAFHDYAFAVAAVDCHGRTDPRHKQGSYIDLAAPGRNIYYLDGDGLAHLDPDTWTSFSAPIVSGAMALLLGADPDLANEDCYNLLRLSARAIPDSPAVRVGSGLLTVNEALRLVLPPHGVEHRTTSAYLLEDDGAWSVRVRNLDPDSSSEAWDAVWVAAHRLVSRVNLPQSVVRPYVWNRGRLSSGWRRMDDSTGATYDGHLYANHADLEWVDSNTVDVVSYTYEIFEEEGGDFLGWFPFDPENPLGPPYRLDYTYVTNTSPAAADDRVPADRARVRVRQEGAEVVFAVMAMDGSPSAVRIFDAGGRLVRLIRDDRQDVVGWRSIRWDGRDNSGRRVPSGVYFGKVWPSEGRYDRSGVPVRIVVVR